MNDKDPEMYRFFEPELKCKDNNIKALRENDVKLTSLVISELTLDEHDIKDIAEGLLHNTHLESLALTSCVITDEVFMAIMKSLESNCTLKTLDLRYNKISDRGIRDILSVFENNNTLMVLNLNGNDDISDGCLAKVAVFLLRNQQIDAQQKNCCCIL